MGAEPPAEDLAVGEGLLVASDVVVAKGAFELGVADALAVGDLAVSLAVVDLVANDLLAVELLEAVGGNGGLAVDVVARSLLKHN